MVKIASSDVNSGFNIDAKISSPSNPPGHFGQVLNLLFSSICYRLKRIATKPRGRPMNLTGINITGGDRKIQSDHIGSKLPADGDPGEINAILDLVHLSRQTMGDSKLEQEILTIFRNQCEICDRSLTISNDPKQLAEIAHQMKGCARSVGAWGIAREAAILEDNPSKSQSITHLRDQIHRVEEFLTSMA